MGKTKLKEIKSDLVENALLDNVKVVGFHNYVEIIDSTINSCDFSEAIFQGIDITNVEINNSNLSNIDLHDHSLKKVKFSNCNLTGIFFSDLKTVI